MNRNRFSVSTVVFEEAGAIAAGFTERPYKSAAPHARDASFVGRTAELKPLVISHTANTISCNIIGISIITTMDEGSSKPHNKMTRATKINAAAISPHPDNQRGTSLVLYSR